MVFESGYWKHELQKLSVELEASCAHRKGLVPVIREWYFCWKYGPGYSDYLMERNVILSAFIVRLLFESNKLSEECESHYLEMERYEASKHNNETVSPLDRRFDIDKLYDLLKPSTVRMNLKKFTNQVIHSAVVLSFMTDDSLNIVGFFVVSDYDSMKGLYYCSIHEWLKLIRQVANDDVVSASWLWDAEQGKWTVSRSRKLPAEDAADFFTKQTD